MLRMYKYIYDTYVLCVYQYMYDTYMYVYTHTRTHTHMQTHNGDIDTRAERCGGRG